MALAYGGPLSHEAAHYLQRLNLAERFGWTLDYIDSMDTWEFRRTVVLLDARDRAQAHVNKPRGK